MKILLDTSFLITTFKNKIRWEEELRGEELYVLDGVIKELERLKKEKKEINLILELLKKNKVRVIKGKKEKVDDALIEERDYAVATQDKELKKRLKGRKIISIRQGKYLMRV